MSGATTVSSNNHHDSELLSPVESLLSDSSLQQTPNNHLKSTRSLRRNQPGTKFENAYHYPHIQLDQIDSAFALQEYLQSLIRTDKENIDLLVELPDGQDEETWQYEHLRQLCLELNHLTVQLSSECTRQSCPEMKANEWMYLCAMHQTPEGCCAIDYIVHTLDGATSLLNNHKHFPSRISIPPASLKHYQQIARRLYRIFAHAYFHHPEIFHAFENENFLYARFLKFLIRYGLVPNNLIIIPGYETLTSNDASSESLNISSGNSSVVMSTIDS